MRANVEIQDLTPLVLVALLMGVPALAEERVGDHPTGVPFRIRDLTVPNFLLLGFLPRPGAQLGEGRWAAEVHYSVVNDFQVSTAVEDYLEQSRPAGERRPLDLTDVAALESLPEGDAFYIDGEFGLLNVVGTYGVTEYLDVSLELNYLTYGGGEMDSFIEEFHDTFGLGQQGRNFVEQDRFQIVIGPGDGETGLVLLEKPSSGGLGDPIVRLRYAIPGDPDGWRTNVGLGLKAPVADEERFLSSGNWDVGLTVTTDRRWDKLGLILGANLVSVGDFVQVSGSTDQLLLSAEMALMRTLGDSGRWVGLLQINTGENIFSDLGGSELGELAIQGTIGVKRKSRSGIWGFAVTENILNQDSTVDVGGHLSWGRIFD